MSAEALVPGLYGKLPVRGDFVARHLPRSFVDSWDAWLSQVISRSQEQLGAAWLEHYLSSPIWRFALSGGLCGDVPFAGVLMPSVDGVGRYFPLTLAVELAEAPDLPSLTITAHIWFEEAERLALAGLDDHLDLEDFAARVRKLGSPPCMAAPIVPNESAASAEVGWHCTVDDLAGIERSFPMLTGSLLQRAFPGCSLWWSSGSQRMAPCLLICEGLPSADGFSAMLTGDWADRGWFERPLSGAEESDGRAPAGGAR